MTVFEYIKWIVIGIMAWMCFSIGLQLYYQTPASISPRVRKFLYKKQHVDKELDKTTSDREYIIPDIYDLISNGLLHCMSGSCSRYVISIMLLLT